MPPTSDSGFSIMAKEAFDKIMGGLHEAKAYMDGERKGFAVHEPLDIKAVDPLVTPCTRTLRRASAQR